MTAVRLAIVLGVILIIGTALLFLIPAPPDHEEGTIDTGEYMYAAGNFALTPSSGWLRAADADLPDGFGGFEFAFKKEGTSCVLAYIDDGVQAPWHDTYKQTTPGERIYLGKTQIDSWWWAPKRVLPDQFEPQFEGRVPFAGEVLVGTAAYVVPIAEGRPSFILYTHDGATVPDQCATDVAEMLKTYRDAFETVERVSGTGILRIVRSSVAGVSFLAFKASNSDRYEKIDAGPMSYENNLIHDNKVYALRDGAIVVIDIFAGTESALQGVKISSDVVLDLYIRENRLWYLLGKPGCTDYMARCDLQLYQINASGGTPVLLSDAIHLESGSIMGFDPATRMLYVRSAFGDAGMYHYTIYAYSYDSNSVTEVLEDSGSSDDDPGEHRAANATLQAIQTAISSPLPVHEFVAVRPGNLSRPDFERPAGLLGEATFTFPL